MTLVYVLDKEGNVDTSHEENIFASCDGALTSCIAFISDI